MHVFKMCDEFLQKEGNKPLLAPFQSRFGFYMGCAKINIKLWGLNRAVTVTARIQIMSNLLEKLALDTV